MNETANYQFITIAPVRNDNDNTVRPGEKLSLFSSNPYLTLRC